MKILRNIFYFLLFFGLIKHYRTNRKLDVLLIYLKEVGIRKIETLGECRSSITFNDNTKFDFWNTNRWYAWMNEGRIRFSNGKELSWRSELPSSEVLYKFRKVILKYEKELLKKEEDFSEYLPISIIRKRKLKKLNNVINL